MYSVADKKRLQMGGVLKRFEAYHIERRKFGNITRDKITMIGISRTKSKYKYITSSLKIGYSSKLDGSGAITCAELRKQENAEDDFGFLNLI